MDSSAWDARYASASGLVWSAEPNRFVVESVTGLTPGAALDLAAGEGRNAVWLAEQGWRVTAVDFAPVAVERGRELAAARGVPVEWRVADVTAYRPVPGSYELVLISYLHLPAPDLAGVLDSARGALRPGGTLVVVGHDLANLRGGTGGPQDPAVLLTPEAVVDGLAGLRIQRAETARRPVPTSDGGSIDALDTVVVATRPAG
ncbi:MULTISPECIES: class I SAM-dependent methyltransferase [Micromonospora]|uniref:Class I SAM-dependent methyltransferase n=1 Tax=Micromonospora solifontis TaxID=2487138 RepID=A0ABX9WKT5_9ACTN|nr:MULTISPECIES: class I SAM-dependent methyltransferase [Micromonospora]NES16001.1 class I SAM-dependent methyltransferase [Micromonospora sp. PPF5-17B]NES36578.1 class I SAM-dependent methyltransferase [Micromonospora solifontis]NES57328.1 class I SAM-dependent methyltransferase [Micromonospora sp. PPF5-6]RNL99316.1 class I SAM-dependent methyltransferase [Micromonospora solifontis]